MPIFTYLYWLIFFIDTGLSLTKDLTYWCTHISWPHLSVKTCHNILRLYMLVCSCLKFIPVGMFQGHAHWYVRVPRSCPSMRLCPKAMPIRVAMYQGHAHQCACVCGPTCWCSHVTRSYLPVLPGHQTSLMSMSQYLVCLCTE